MKTLIGLIISALLVSGEIVIVESTVYSSPETAVKFSDCMVIKMKETHFFTFEEIDGMSEVKDVFVQALFQKNRSPHSCKLLLIAFTTSLADIIILDDVASNNDRTDIYASALEQCSVISSGSIDTEFINEALRIYSTFHNNKIIEYKEKNEFSRVGNPDAETFSSVSHSQVTSYNNQFAIHPSPVQSPSSPQDLYSNDKTVSQPQEKTYFPFPASVNSQYETSPLGQMRFDIGLETQSGNVPPRFDYPSNVPILESEKLPNAFGSNGMLQSEERFLGDTGKITGFNDGESVMSSYDESSQIGQINTGDASQISFGGLSIPQTKESTVIVIPPNTNQQFIEHSSQVTSQKSLEKINLPPAHESAPYEEKSFIMLPPTVIAEDQEKYSDVTPYAELGNILYNILKESPKFRETFNSKISQENAINLAQVITEKTFADYDLNIVNDALSAVTKEVIKIRVPTPENFAFALSKAFVSVLKLHDTSLSTDGSQLASSFLFSLDNSGKFYLQPENTEEQFQDSNSEADEKATDLDFQSPPLSPEDIKDEIFSLSLAQYLSHSNIIRNFFCGDSEADDKVQIFFSVIESSLIEYSTQVASLAASVTSGGLSELSEEELCHNYAKTIAEAVAEIFEEKGIDDASAENISNEMEMNLNQRQSAETELQKHFTVPYNSSQGFPEVEIYATAPNLESSFTPIEEIIPHHDQTNTGHPDLTALTDSEDVSEYEFTYTSTNVDETESTEESDSYDWAPDDIIDQETLANYFTDQFEYALSSYNSKENKPKDSTGEEISTSVVTIKQYENTDNEFSEEEFSQEGAEEEESYGSIPTKKVNNFFYNQDDDEIPQKNTVYSDPTEPKVKISPVELQPSFQDPVLHSDDSSAISQANSDIIPYDPNYSNSHIEIARQVSETAQSSIAYIHSQNFDLNNLCGQINQLAPLVHIPALDYCENVAAIDYLLNVLVTMVKMLNED